MLTTDKVSIKFGGLTAVNEVSIHIKPNIITGLIGPNGAGKTTLFNAVSGVYKPTSGAVTFNGEIISGLKPHQINVKGISRTYQIINLFWKMDVIDNVLVGMHPRLKSNYITDLFYTPGQRREEKEIYERAIEWLKFVGLEHNLHDPAASLSYGQQRLLEIVRGLASNPKLLLLDEPAAGMNSKEKEELDDLLQKILGLGVTILMIEHDMKLVMDVCHFIYVLNSGKLLAQGAPEEVQNNPEVITAYLGGE
jgi:branched-chain amino acid transport system ATP-binding protein